MPSPETALPPAGISRRKFLTRSFVGAGVLALGGLGYRIAALPDGAPAVAGGVLTRQEMAAIEKLALAFFPPGNPMGIDGKDADVAGYVDRYTALLSPLDQKIMRSLFWVYDQATFFEGHLGSVRQLPQDKVRAYVLSWETSSLGFRRDLAMSLRTVLGMAYFVHPKVKAALTIQEPCPPAGPSLLRLTVPA